jgi:hypothetical protein
VKNFIQIKLQLFIIATTLACSSHAWTLFGPKNFEDCVLDGVKSAKTEQASNAVIMACRNKFPPKSNPSAAPKIESPEHFIFSGLGSNRPQLNLLINNIKINHLKVIQTGTNVYGVKSYDYGHYLSAEITNRNEFPITGIEIGLSGGKGNCTMNDRDYSEIYTCEGLAGSRQSAAFKCYIPRVESRKFFTCITGLRVYGTPSDVQGFMARYQIPQRARN